MSDSNFMKANGGKPVTATSSANSSAPNSQARLMESSGNSHLNDTAAPKSTPSGGGSSSAVDVLIPARGGPTNINNDAPTSSSSVSNAPTSRGGTGGAASSSREASHQAQPHPQQQSSSQQQQQQPHHSRTTTGHSVSGGAAAAAVQHSSSPSNVTATSSGQYNNHHNNNSNAAAAAVTLAATEEAFLTSPLTIGFDGVTVMLDSSRGHVAIEKASGLIRGGRLTGIVSCCGARGDYTLLNALAGYEECATGTILANGTPVFAPAFRKSSVLLDEDFTAMDDLTVRQNLQYAASMRVASLDSDSVDATIGLLNLESVEHRAVSRCNAYTRRRVALGKELLLRPRAIFIDQPVQGLATHEARQYLQLLRRVAQKRVVVVTLVQPRWVLLELMDDVILLEGKLVAYNGTSAALLQILHVDAEQIPDSALTSIYRLASSPECSLYESFQRLLAHHQRSSGGEHHHHHHGNVANPTTSSDPNALVISNHATATSPQVELFFQLCAEGRIYFDPVVRSSPNPHWQFLVLVQYSLYRVRNNVVLLSTLFAVVLIVAIILAAIYSSQTGQSGMQNRIGMIFFLVSSTFLQNMLFVETRRREFLSFLRHRAHGYYGAALYLIFTVVSTAFVRFLTSAVFTVIVYSLGNIGSGEWAYSNLRDLVAIVALTSYSTNLVVYFVTSIARTARIAHFILFALYTFDVILAGIILNVNTLPKPFQVVSLMSHVRLGYEVAVITQFVGQDFGCVKGGGNYNTTESCYTGDEYLNFLGFSEDRRWPNVELLFLLSGITVVVWYLVMVFYKPPRAAMLAAQFTKSHR